MQRQRKPIVLAVDDDVEMGTLLRNLLSDLGYEVVVADSGMAALELFDAVQPDLVITDIYMASGDGHQFINAIRNKRRTMPILAMSGGACAEAVLDFARKIGADGVIQKPFQRSEIVALIDRHLWTRAGPPAVRSAIDVV